MGFSSILPPGVCCAEITRGDGFDVQPLAEEMQALGRVSEGRLRDFTMGRACAHSAIRKLGVEDRPIGIGAARDPVWPGGIVGSITHCKGYWAAAVARSRDISAVGIDAELDAALPPGIIDMIASDSERHWLRQSADAFACCDRLLFSAKESFYKAWYPLTRTWLDFKEASVRIDVLSGRFFVRVLVDGPIEFAEGRFLSCDGYILTAVVLERL